MRVAGARTRHQRCYGRRRAQDYDDDYEEEYEQNVYQGLTPAEAIDPPRRPFPVIVAIPAVLLVAFTLFRIFKKIQGMG